MNHSGASDASRTFQITSNDSSLDSKKREGEMSRGQVGNFGGGGGKLIMLMGDHEQEALEGGNLRNTEK